MSNKNNDDLKYQASENTLGLNPVVGLRGKDLLASARMVLKQAIKQPIHSVRHVTHFGLELKNVLFGKSNCNRQAMTVASLILRGARTRSTNVICKLTWRGARNFMPGSMTAASHPKTSRAATLSST